MSEKARDQSLHVLTHALGLDDYGRGKSYRNHYTAGEGHHSWGLLMEHVAAGRMIYSGPREIYGRDCCFEVTDAGREYVRANSPAAPLYWHCLNCGAHDPVEPTGGPERYTLGDREKCIECGDGTAHVMTLRMAAAYEQGRALGMSARSAWKRARCD